MPYDPATDGFSNSRMLYVVSELGRMTAVKASQMSYGTWNPQYCAADAAAELIDFCGSLRRYMAHYERQARKAIGAQWDRNPKGHDPAEGHGRNDESPVAAGDAPEDYD